MPSSANELRDILRREIDAQGPLSSARFMELALFHPVHGYYERSLKQIGCQGDFYTSVSVGPLFGELLAVQFAAWLDSLPPAVAGRSESSERPPLLLVEAGAHDGRLALDILSWFFRVRPDAAARIQYWILEPSLRRRQLQQEALQSVIGKVLWCSGWPEFPAGGVRGIIFSNEFLDALPTFRLGWDSARRAWFEWRVGWARDGFVWERSDRKSPEVDQELARPFWQDLPPDLLNVLPDGFTVEVCPAARSWWAQAAGCLRQGKLLTLDYGLEALEFFAAHRSRGTLRAYRGHRMSEEVLAHPGEQDLTAHVNFSAIQAAGEAAGLTTEFDGTQARFLTGALELALASPGGQGSWPSERVRQFQTLTHPEHLGRSFRVLVQAR